ncbi:hypothetical protein FSP39_022389 [Pinctada imbricata]|uniref:Glycolipid transfer protein domain-containing protein n=1 Tax=Pinctada imbricata TaxID=66713 RepID=A0AA88YI61_PINIB|nr:hypothetical protein FSP39_022389 [Pinctada imbricata]
MATFDTDTKHDFDLEVVKTEFKKCRVHDDRLLLDNYLNAFTELNRFFRLSGRIFGFVAKDLEDKIHILQSHRKSDKGERYESIQGMVNYEKSNQLLQVKGHLPSGSRTLLRLHRASEFILTFMARMSESDDHDKSSHIAAEVYSQTLAKHHPWLVQKMAGVAMYILPSRKQLLETMCKHDYAHVSTLLNETVSAGKPVYEITQKLYEENDLLDLP